jgi:hypothetical protein
LPDTLTVAMMLIVRCVFGNNNEMKHEAKVCFGSCWCYFVCALFELKKSICWVEYSFVIISWYWRLMTQKYLGCCHLHIIDIYIHILRLGVSDPCLLITLIGPSCITLLAGRSDGRLGHVSCKSVQRELGAITLLREVCFDCYLLRLAWLMSLPA